VVMALDRNQRNLLKFTQHVWSKEKQFFSL